MCIVNRLSGKERKALLAKKPKILKVWKVISGDGSSRYSTVGACSLMSPKIHEAQIEPAHKAVISYKPGFHVYLVRRTAEKSLIKGFTYKVQEFYIRKSWVTQIGKDDCGRRVYVSKKITCDRSLLK